MKNDNMAYCWNSLEGMSTAQLDDLLQEELHRTPPDGDNVRLILRVLEKRDKAEETDSGSEVEKAWIRYQNRSGGSPVKPVKKHGWLLRAASVALIVGALALVVPQTVQAEGLFDRVARWTDSFFQLLGFGDADESVEEYVFQTDNPGLQQVYDAVVEMGITEPVVPMWLPAGYKLIKHDTDIGIDKTVISAEFQDGEQRMVYSMNVYSESLPSQYFIDESQVIAYEVNGVTHNIMRNGDVWLIVWIKDNIECHISIDCQEEKLYRVIKSIYLWRLNE